MSDPEDGAGGDGPSDVPADEDPFEYPAEKRRDADAGAEDATDADAVDAGPDDRNDADGADARNTAGNPETRPSAGATRTRTDAPPADGRAEDGGGLLHTFWTADSGAAVYARDVLTSVAAVLMVGVLLFAVSGIWPPMVAVESGSMEPNMNVGDLVFVVDNDRFVPEHEVANTGVVPADRAAEVGHKEFGRYGDVIVFMPGGNDRRTPVIHRAMLFVEEGENWYDRADRAAVGSADDCEELDHCPAPHAGFITQGDNQRSNTEYDQVSGLTEPVHPGWVIGTAEVKIPYLGHVRLLFSGQVAVPLDEVTTTGGATPAATPPANESRTVAGPSTGTVTPVA